MSKYTGDPDNSSNADPELNLPADHVTLRKAKSVNDPVKDLADQVAWQRTMLPVTNTRGVDPAGDTYADGTYAVQVEAGAITLVPFSSGAVRIPGQDVYGDTYSPFQAGAVAIAGQGYTA